MSYKKTDRIIKNWRISTQKLSPISDHFTQPQELNENWRDKLFQLAATATLILGTGISIGYLKNLEKQSKERIEQRDKVDLDSMEEAEKYHYLLKKEVEKQIKENPDLLKKFTDPKSELFSVYKDGIYKGKVDRVAVMHKYVKKYKQDLNMTDNGNYVYVEPGAIDSDEVLPMWGITVEQYKTILNSDKNFMELTRVAMGNPDSWVYGRDPARQFATIEYEGQYKNVLPLDWSIAMDMATVKGQEFMEEVAAGAFDLDPKTGFKTLNVNKFNKIKKKYGIHNQSDYQKAMWNLNDFVKTDSHSVWDQIEDFAGVHRAQPNYDPKPLRGYDVDPDTLPLESSLQTPSNPDDMPENPIHIYVGAPSNVKESIKKRRKVCIKILKS